MVKWDDGTGRAPERAQMREATQLGGEPPDRQPGKRKNTRRWCKGKVGVEHTLVVRMRRDRSKGCHWFAWSVRGKAIQRGAWICVEQEVCISCGKILRHTLGKNCTHRGDYPLRGRYPNG
jgi:hypothetical protein